MTVKTTQLSPWGLLSGLQNEFNRLALGHPLEADPTSSLSTMGWNPLVDITEEKDRFVIKADVPGVAPGDVEITLENGVMTLKGQRTDEQKESDQEGYQRIERTQGAFIRRFTLPDTVDEEKVNAAYRNGVVEILVPKKEKAQPRRIDLRSS